MLRMERAPAVRPLGLRHPRGLLLVLCLVGSCTIHKLSNRAVWDDGAILGRTTALLHAGKLGELFDTSTLELIFDESSDASKSIDLFRPVALVSFALVTEVAGPDPLYQHLVNTLLHLACVCWVYVLGRKLTRNDGTSLFAAAWLGFTPVLLETHVWISGRFDLLSTCFGLGGLYCWRRARESQRGFRCTLWSCCAAVVFELGLLSKEPLLFTLPALLAWPEPEPMTWRARLRTSIPLICAGASYIGVRLAALSAAPAALSPGELGRAVAHFPVLLLDAASQLVLPRQVFARALNEDYAALGSAGAVCAALIVVGLGALLVRARQNAPALVFGVLWFACALAPVALTTTRLWPGFGRYVYLPATLCLPVLSDVALRASMRSQRVREYKRAIAGALLAYLVVLALRSHAGVYAFATDATLFRAIIAESPARSHGYGFLALSDTTTDPSLRLELLRAALERAPDERRWAARYGSTLLFQGDERAALEVAERSIRRFELAPEFHLLAAYASLDSDQRAAARHVLECLLQDKKHKEGREALLFLRTRHPDAADFRKQFAQLFHEPRYAALAHGG